MAVSLLPAAAVCTLWNKLSAVNTRAIAASTLGTFQPQCSAPTDTVFRNFRLQSCVAKQTTV